MKPADTNLARTMLIVSILLILFLSSHPYTVTAQASVVNIISYRVEGAPNYNAPGNESFWNNIGWTNVPLSATVKPGGGQTANVLVKSANDGFNIYVLFRWDDNQGPSYGSSPEVYVNSTGQLVDLNFSDTGAVHQLYYSSTYYYPDRVAMLWFLNGTRDVVPAMSLNTTGAITDGSANIWHWQAVSTDNNPADTSYPGNYTDPRGKLIFPPNNSSFAEDDYTDKTGFFPIAGNVSISSSSPPFSLNLDPYGNPYAVLAGNYFSTTNKTWTVEMVRPLTESQDAKYRVQLEVGASYFVGFGVWNGKMGESAHIKSVSDWYSFTVSNQTPTSPPTPATGVSLSLAAAAGTGLLIAGLIVGFLIKPERKKPNP
jgi:ethylbenzene dehydrogenase